MYIICSYCTDRLYSFKLIKNWTETESIILGNHINIKYMQLHVIFRNNLIIFYHVLCFTVLLRCENQQAYICRKCIYYVCIKQIENFRCFALDPWKVCSRHWYDNYVNSILEIQNITNIFIYFKQIELVLILISYVICI